MFVRPKKIVLDFQKGKAVGPVRSDFKSGEMQEGNKDFVGELSVTLVDARKLSYVFYGKLKIFLSTLQSHVLPSFMSLFICNGCPMSLFPSTPNRQLNFFLFV